MSVELLYQGIVQVKETLSTGVAYATAPVITHDGLNTGATYTASTSIPVAKVAAFLATLSSGALTINLAALVGTNGAAVDLTGLKVQSIKLKATSTNSGMITVAEGASNGIPLFGTAATFGLRAGQECQWLFNELGSDVASGDRTLDLTGTGAETLSIIIVAG